MRFKFLVTLLLVSFTVHSEESEYELASAQGREDSTNPAYQDWYLGSMRPAFDPVFQKSLSNCASYARGNELTSMGLVFTVKLNGSVGDFIVTRESKFSRCLESEIRATTFPGPPKDSFHFGLDFSPPADS